MPILHLKSLSVFLNPCNFSKELCFVIKNFLHNENSFFSSTINFLLNCYFYNSGQNSGLNFLLLCSYILNNLLLNSKQSMRNCTNIQWNHLNTYILTKYLFSGIKNTFLKHFCRIKFYRKYTGISLTKYNYFIRQKSIMFLKCKLYSQCFFPSFPPIYR